MARPYRQRPFSVGLPEHIPSLDCAIKAMSTKDFITKYGLEWIINEVVGH